VVITTQTLFISSYLLVVKIEKLVSKMALVMAGDEVTISTSSRRSFREMWPVTAAAPDVFERGDRHTQEDDEYQLTWAAIERLPTFERMRKGVIKHVDENGKVVHDEVDVAKLGFHDKKLLLDSILKIVEEDNEKFLRKLRDRQDRFVSSSLYLIDVLDFLDPSVGHYPIQQPSG
jgi:hypothetical protein